MSHEFLEQLEGKVLSVEEYLGMVNDLLSPLRVSVEGEVTDLKVLPQWVFFALKDAESGAVLRCGLHSGQYRRIGVNLEEGMAIKVCGYGKLAAKSGNFGFWVSKIEPVGEGALRRAYELLVKKLSEEGLFTRKRDLPQFISHVGVISSRNGVVLQDLQQNLDPLGIRIDFVHAGVEGADSAGDIERAIRHFSTTTTPPQVLVLIRGGGSLESLQGFNNEAVVRALYAAPMPVLVGIGHDVDAPIATMVADWSASTPTAVAHVINASWEPLTVRVPALVTSMLHTYRARVHGVEHTAVQSLQRMRRAVTQLLARFSLVEAKLRRAWQRIPSTLQARQLHARRSLERSRECLKRALQRCMQRTNASEQLLAVVDPSRVLKRGFSLSYTASGKLARSVQEFASGDCVQTHLADGIVDSTVTKVTKQ